MDWKPPYEWEKVSTIYIGIEYRTNTTNSMYIYIYIYISLFTGIHTYLYVQYIISIKLN